MGPKNIQRLIKKVGYLEWCNQWYGYVTSVEIEWLILNGATPCTDCGMVSFLLDYITIGKGGGHSFYFRPSKDLLTIINKDKKKKERTTYEH